MKEWMNKSADCVGAVMGRSIIGLNAKWQHGSEKNETEGRERVRWRWWGSVLGNRIKEKREGRAWRGGGGEFEEMQEGFKWSEREREQVRWAAVYVLTWNHLSFLSGAQLSWKSANINDCLSCLYIFLFSVRTFNIRKLVGGVQATCTIFALSANTHTLMTGCTQSHTHTHALHWLTNCKRTRGDETLNFESLTSFEVFKHLSPSLSRPSAVTRVFERGGVVSVVIHRRKL